MLTSRKFNFCIGILVSILIMGSFVAAQDDSVRKELEAVYAKRDQAIKARDADFLKSLLAADYKEKDKDGKITNRTDVTNSFDKDAADKDITEVSSASKIESIKQGRDANEAIVETSLTLNMTAMMNGQPHQLQVNGKSRDTWMRNETGWKMKFSENVDAAMTQVDAAWINYTSPEGRYAVSLPSQPKVDTDQATKAYRAMSTSLSAVFLVEYLDLGTDSTFSIDDTLKGGMNENSTILARNPINIAGFPGNQLIESKKDSSGDTVMETRITKVGARVYFVVFGYPKSMESDAIKAKGTKFFDSFHLSKLSPTETVKRAFAAQESKAKNSTALLNFYCKPALDILLTNLKDEDRLEVQLPLIIFLSFKGSSISEAINGDTADVTYVWKKTAQEEGGSSTLHLVNEDNRWVLCLTPEALQEAQKKYHPKSNKE